MRLKLFAPLAAALVCAASAATAEEADDDHIRPAELPADAPLYCQPGEDDPERLEGLTVGTFHAALRHKFPTWSDRVGMTRPGEPRPTLIAVFADFREDHSYDHMARFYFTKRERGWAVAYADFVEPDRPLMHSVGEPLCDYVAEVAQGSALPKR